MELPSSKDVEDERLKLQQDIKKIQDTLYEDSYSDYDSDSDSECLEIDLERRNQTDDDGQTRSSVGESSTSHLGGTEVSDATDFDRELFVSDADATELPITTESSLALNRAYQEVIVDILRQTEESLEENRRRQEDAERDLIGQREKNLSNAQYKVYYRQYSMPFIKDPNGGIPPANEDVLLKKMLKEHKQDIMPERDWLVRDRKRMYDAIAEDSLQQLLQPLMIKLELEQEKLEKCEKADEAAIAARISKLEDEIANKKSTSRADLLRKVDVQKTDWLKISNIAYDGRKSWQECQMMWMNVLNPSVNRGKWDINEDNQLVSFVNMYKGKNWVKIAESLNTGRTAFQCLQRYQVYLNPENLNRPWTAAEDKKMLQIVRNIRNSGHRLVWGKVSSYMENRSANMCFSRFHQIDPDMKRGAWDKEEDLNLYTAVQMVGLNSWTKIAEFVPGRNSLQCRDRWTNSLDPSIRMGNWTYEEDKALLLAAQELGTKSWTKLASRLPGRTDNQVLQRYKRLENWERKMKWFEALPEVTRRALLGCHLSPEEMKAREHMTWESFKRELCIDREDYKKQERDRAKGDIVVPRPPPLTGFTTMVPKRTIDSRIQLQNIILKHVRSIQGHSDEPIPDLQGSEMHQDLAVKVQFADANNVSVKKLLELSRHMKRSLALPDKQLVPQVHRVKRSPKKNYNVVAAVRIKRKLEEMLRASVQSIFKTKRKMKKGRPRKFFNKSLTGNYSEEEFHNIKVKSLNLIMKALDVDARKMLHSATMVKENKSTSGQSAPSTSSTPKPNTTPCSKKSRMTPKRQKQETQKEVADNEAEDEEVGDVGMLKSVSQKEAEGSQAGQEDPEEIEGIVMGMDKTKQDSSASTVAESETKATIQESPRREHSTSILAKPTSGRTPQKKSVTFVLNDKDSNKTVTLSNPSKVTRIVVQSFVKQPVSQSKPCSTSASTIVRPASASTLSVIKPTLPSTSAVISKAATSALTVTTAISASTSTVTSAKPLTNKSVSASTVVMPASTLTVIKPTSASTSAVMAKATASTSTAASTSTSTATPAKAVTYKSVSTQVLAVSDSESSDESDYENEKSLPLLPPNATSMTAFKSLLLNRKKNMAIAGPLYNPTFYHLPPSKYKSRPAQVTVDAASVNRKRGREADESDAQPAKKVATSAENGDKVTSLSRERLREIRRTDEYQLLKARFQSIFVWPALMSAIHPPFDRKDFCQKANFVTAGEEEVAHVERIRTKGYPLDRTRKFYQKQVRPRAKKAEMKKKKEKGGPSNLDEQENKDEQTGQDNTDLVTNVTVADDTQDATPSEPPVKRRGRPRGKTKPHAKVICERSMRERKEKVVPEKPPPEKPRRLRVAKKRAVLNDDLRKSMLESVAAMKEGLIPDPAKKIHVNEPSRPTGVIVQSSPIQNNLVREMPESGMTNKYTVVLPTLKPSKTKTSPPEKVSSSVSGTKHAEKNAQTSAVNSQSTPDKTPPSEPVASASVFVPVATTTNTTSTADTVSVPITNCASGIPMVLSYVAGVDGNVVPVLNPLPVKLLQNICSTTASVPQVKVEEKKIEPASVSSQSQGSGSVPAAQSVESVNTPSTSESVGSVSVCATQTKMSVSVPATTVMETSLSKSSKES